MSVEWLTHPRADSLGRNSDRDCSCGDLHMLDIRVKWRSAITPAGSDGAERTGGGEEHAIGDAAGSGGQHP
jgi:hypothetical protein